MKIIRKTDSTFVQLDLDGKVTLHLPYFKEEVPRLVRELLVLLAMWEARDKQLMMRMDASLKRGDST